ncbi:hypothetical protein GRZ55_11240 [Chelativorans sp. ZYF759]|uniref:hypothetical protein n=1 Tax=Chelativorans sp. ZYF759 TaxID=2692213 RepID=UPI00145F9282|nr:hypothetical protein [Chelativorans sp. ZYF759]NMG39818.1 hypothetical protein [Chelativorans sp. ZYF759]
MDTVEINGVQVDFDDPCAVAKALRKAELAIVTGSGVATTRFGDDEVRWHAGNLARLRELISQYEGQCAAKTGKRVRFAKRMRFVR